MAQDLYWPKMDPSLYQVGIIFNLNMFNEHCSFSSMSFCSGPRAAGSVWPGFDGPHQVPPAVCRGPETPGELRHIQERHPHPDCNRDPHDIDAGTIRDGWRQLGRPLKGLLRLLPNQLGCRAPHFYRFVFFTISLTVLLILSISTGFNMGGAGRGYPFYDPISFQRQSQVGQSVQNFNTFGAKKIGFNSTGVTATRWFSHFPRTCKAEIEKSQLISRLSACFKTPSLSRLGLSRRLPAPT